MGNKFLIYEMRPGDILKTAGMISYRSFDYNFFVQLRM